MSGTGGRRESPRKLSHVAGDGTARMVDVGGKSVTARRAAATGVIRMAPTTLQLILDAGLAKGDVVATARIAGIMAAKRAAELIPLCHPLLLDDVQVEVAADAAVPGLRVRAVVRTTGRTGAEMEALTAVSVTLLTIYDMAKAADRGMIMSDIVLEAKSGGQSGELSSLAGIGSAR